MSKYKYEKEFMFSIKRVEEVQLFLEDQQSPLDLPAIRDNHRNTVIHHTAYHNQPKVMETYLKYFRKNLQSKGHSIAEIKLYTRHFLDEPNAEGYTAAHYAAYRGNISVLKLLQKYEAHLLLTNHLKMTVLHLAAQGDKPATFLHLHPKKLNINQKDDKQSTPLHWASFAGSEKIVDYLLAQPQIQVNQTDSEGLTPLHLAATYGNSKIVKKLLLAGADRHLKNLKNLTAQDIAQEKQFQGIARMLNDKYTLLDKIKIICNTRMKYQPVEKSDFYPTVFAVLSLFFLALPFAVLQPNNLILFIVEGLLLALTLLLFCSLVFQNRKVPVHLSNYQQYAQTTRIYHLCMICVRQMRPRQHHCPICNICIKQYDHHCTWINNCVGKHNLARFNLLLWLLEIVLLAEAYMAVETIIGLVKGTVESPFFTLRQWNQSLPEPAYAVSIIVLILAVLFAIPLLCLIFVQTKNLLLGKTTYERFSKSNQSILTRQSSLLMNQHDLPVKPRLSNCLLMCCGERTHKGEGEHASSTTTSFVREQVP